MKKILIIVGAAVAAGIILTIILGSSIMKQNENTTETTGWAVPPLCGSTS